jgi:hypothetical protein
VTTPVRPLLTEGIMLRDKVAFESGRYRTFKAHRDTCRYATGDAYPIALAIATYGERDVRNMVIAGLVEPCRVCRPVLIADA